MADKRSHATDPETLRAIPAVNGTRIGGTRKPRTRTKALSDCISYNVNDPDNVSIFHAKRGRKQRSARIVEVRDTRIQRDRALAAKIGTIHQEEGL